MQRFSRRVSVAFGLIFALWVLPAPLLASEAPQPLAQRAMVAAANPLAVEAGLGVLRRGGSAVDAAVAVQAVLGLVEPQSSGLGGGAFMVYYHAKTGSVTAYDGREIAPAGASPDMFLQTTQTSTVQPMGYAQAVLSGRSTGVPGAVAMLALAQSQHGNLAWKDLFGDAQRLATGGFVVSPRLAGMITSPAPQTKAPDAVAYFTRPDGKPYAAGDTLKNPAYGATLDRLAREGPSALYQGPLAKAIVDRVQQGELGGSLSLKDFAAYKPTQGKALCRPFRVYQVCVPNAPSGGASVLQGLGLLEGTDIANQANTPKGWYLFSQASRLMYADRDRYMGDPAFVRVPVEGLLAPDYLASRRALIGERAGPAPRYGQPKGAPNLAPDATKEPGGTSHFVVIDPAGNVVSMTTTVESIFGSGRMVGGFFLNNQLTDFSFSPTNADGTAAANAVAPGKRPRSSMAPIIVLDRKGRFVAALGSPGGSSILAYNLKTLFAVLDWKMPMQQAVALPNLVSRGEAYSAEIDRFGPDLVAGLAQQGVTLKATGIGEVSGLHGVIKRKGGYEGGADPRREGVALGF
jgi:gamma-glutamyltranspeptidase/glutathione hydrolase